MDSRTGSGHAATSPTTLVVYDDPQTATVLSCALEARGFTVLFSRDATTTLGVIRSRKVDLVVLDGAPSSAGPMGHWDLSPGDGVLPPVVLTACCPPGEAFATLGQHPETAVPSLPRANPTVLTVGRLSVDTRHRTVWIDDRQVEMSATEFALLAHLAARRGHPQPWKTLLREVWQITEEVGGRDMVKSAVHRLRSRLARLDPETSYIRTMRGIGYLMPEVEPAV